MNKLKAEEGFRNLLERHGNISWADEGDDKITAPYEKIVDIFGNSLTSRERKELIKTMTRNSGYSGDFNRAGVKPPVTYSGIASENGQRFYLAASIYPDNPDFSVFPAGCHEGIHFLSKYGPKNKRIIKKDVPLANIIGVFFRLRHAPNDLEKIAGTDDVEKIKFLQQNPFLLGLEEQEHRDEEHFEAIITSANAYIISAEQGERAGIDYILNLMKEANLI